MTSLERGWTSSWAAQGHPYAQSRQYSSTSGYIRQGKPGPFFVGRMEEPVTKTWLVQQVRQVLRSLGFPQEDYAGHSFRIGAATSAAMAGLRIPQYRRWADGRAQRSSSIFGCPGSSWPASQPVYRRQPGSDHLGGTYPAVGRSRSPPLAGQVAVQMSTTTQHSGGGHLPDCKIIICPACSEILAYNYNKDIPV